MAAGFSSFVGVDFSGSATAGKTIWIATGTPRGAGLAIDGLLPARDIPGSGPGRDHALPTLRRHIAAQTGALIGLDFPFGLPASMVEAPDWRSFAIDFPRRYPDAERFRAACRERTGGRELKRRTDYEARTPFCAYNLRVYRQTWWGIAGILAPLLDADAVSVPPMVPMVDDRPALAEICPASTLKRLGCYPSYKGSGVGAVAARRSILSCLEAGGLEAPAPFARIALADRDGDALDALVAAFTSWQVSLRPAELLPRDEIDRIEARVLF
ncbi:MAG TPA: DUF429 domain-containing protein [Alphaproteobacteria bacterium]|nr:DUF429 domain-containing protein [Alphaproteobacteria bacterium]